MLDIGQPKKLRYATQIEYVCAIIVCHMGFLLSFYLFNFMKLSEKQTFAATGIAVAAAVYLIVMTQRRLNHVGWSSWLLALILIPLLSLALQLILVFAKPKADLIHIQPTSIKPTIVITSTIAIIITLGSLTHLLFPSFAKGSATDVSAILIGGFTIFFLFLSFRRQ
jgi:hypothetical protein